MKKLLAWLMSFFIALFNNVEFTTRDIREYDINNVYRLETEDKMPDYRTQSQILNNVSSSVSCRNRNFFGNGKKIDYKNEEPDIKAYWFLSERKSIDDISNSEKTITLSMPNKEIIAPYNCYLSNENLAANDCTTMELVCVIHNKDAYRISISGMSMWYCDKNRQELLPHTWENPDSNGVKHQFSAGNVLGYTSENTVITVNAMDGGSVTDDAITLRSFFLQE